MNFKERYKFNPRTYLLGKALFARVFKAHEEVVYCYLELKVFSAELSEKYDRVREIRKVVSSNYSNLYLFYNAVFLTSRTMVMEEKFQVSVVKHLDSVGFKINTKHHTLPIKSG